MKHIKQIIIALCIVLAMVVGILIGILYSNQVVRDYEDDWADYSLTACEEDGLKNCHTEEIYQGIVFVDYEVIGTEGE